MEFQIGKTVAEMLALQAKLERINQRIPGRDSFQVSRCLDTWTTLAQHVGHGKMHGQRCKRDVCSTALTEPGSPRRRTILILICHVGVPETKGYLIFGLLILRIH